MRNLLFILLIINAFALSLRSQIIPTQIMQGCEGVSVFPKTSSPDLGIVIYSCDAETVWNALRLANYGQSQGDTVVIFVLGKGIDAFMNDTSKFEIGALSNKFIANGGEVLTCATCAKLRKTEEVNHCTITSINDLYAIIRQSKKVVTF